jgi:hypothetical protein
VPASTLESKIKALAIDKRRFKSASPSVTLARDLPREIRGWIGVSNKNGYLGLALALHYAIRRGSALMNVSGRV